MAKLKCSPKMKRCISKVKRESPNVNAYAV